MSGLYNAVCSHAEHHKCVVDCCIFGTWKPTFLLTCTHKIPIHVQMDTVLAPFINILVSMDGIE